MGKEEDSYDFIWSSSQIIISSSLFLDASRYKQTVKKYKKLPAQPVSDELFRLSNAIHISRVDKISPQLHITIQYSTCLFIIHCILLRFLLQYKHKHTHKPICMKLMLGNLLLQYN